MMDFQFFFSLPNEKEKKKTWSGYTRLPKNQPTLYNLIYDGLTVLVLHSQAQKCLQIDPNEILIQETFLTD